MYALASVLHLMSNPQLRKPREMKRFSSLVFVDDDYPTNRYHQIVVEEADCTDEVLFFEMPNEAIDYFISEREKPGFQVPDLFFVDMNMPRYNGFQFLDQLAAVLPLAQTKAAMLSTSEIPADRQKAKNYPQIIGFATKPLSEEMLNSFR